MDTLGRGFWHALSVACLFVYDTREYMFVLTPLLDSPI